MNFSMLEKAAPPRALSPPAPRQPMQESGCPMRLLMVCTRDPRGRMSGRKMVLRTILDSLVALGHHVTVCHFGASSGPSEPGEKALFLRLPQPTAVELALNATLALLLGRRSLNEALYDSSRAHHIVDKLASWNGYDLVITDMIRTAGYGARTGLPWIADLDDLLSARYAHLAAGGSRGSELFGYHAAPLFRRLATLSASIRPMILWREAKILTRREAEIVRRADLVTLVSEAEAGRLGERTGRPVTDTPMAVRGPRTAPPDGPRPLEAVFLGGLDYGPNLAALRQFEATVIPGLQARGIDDLVLHVIGTAAAEHQVGLSDAIRFRGYVADLDAELQRYGALVVPEVAPGGVKTKIIVAALNGTLVLAHVSALDGMGLTPGRNVLAWSDAAGLARLLADLRAGVIDRAEIARAARAWALARYSPAVLRARWGRNLAACIAIAHSRPPRQTGAPQVRGARRGQRLARPGVGRGSA